MSEPVSEDSFRERWNRAAEKLRGEHSLDAFLQMHESGEVSSLELFDFAYMHWYEYPDARVQFLSPLAIHESEDIREVAERLSALIARHH
ncbi:MAG TPA: hypothetical protein VN688_07805 [Gemmataceae bacterium]|nr:hypothetical protein [Gemmataceae bacterium]